VDKGGRAEWTGGLALAVSALVRFAPEPLSVTVNSLFLLREGPGWGDDKTVWYWVGSIVDEDDWEAPGGEAAVLKVNVISSRFILDCIAASKDAQSGTLNNGPAGAAFHQELQK